MNRNFILIIVIILAFLGGFFLLKSVSETPTSPSPKTPPPTEERIVTVVGETTCLPKIGPGPHTRECAIGLKGDNGFYYGLRNLFEHDPDFIFSEIGTKAEVTGIFHLEEILGPDGSQYDTVGAIEIISIKMI